MFKYCTPQATVTSERVQLVERATTQCISVRKSSTEHQYLSSLTQLIFKNWDYDDYDAQQDRRQAASYYLVNDEDPTYQHV